MAAAAADPPGRSLRPSYPKCRPGFRFAPTDEELVACYLLPKIAGDGEERDGVDEVIPTVDLYGGAAAYPWRVCQRLAYPYRTGGTEFYCFTPRRQKYGVGDGGGSRPDRTVGFGTWNANGGDTPIYHRGIMIGHKANLTFKVLPPGGGSAGRTTAKKPALVNTHWVMHEFRLEKPGFQKMVLCRVRNQRKEHEEHIRTWTPPWWEQLQDGEEGCTGTVDSGNNSKKRKMITSTPPPDDAAVQPPQQQLCRGPQDKRLATAMPSGEDAVVDSQGHSEQGPQPIFMVTPLAMIPPPVASTPPSPSFPLPAAACVDVGDEDALSFAMELEMELLGPSQEEEGGMYYVEASCSISGDHSDAPPLLREEQALLCCSAPVDVPPLLPEEQALLGCSAPADGYCNAAQPAAPVLAESLVPIPTEPALQEGEEEVGFLLSGSSPLWDYRVAEVITPSEEAGSITITTNGQQAGQPHDNNLRPDADGHITSPEAVNACSIPDKMLIEADHETMDQVLFSEMTCNWEWLINGLVAEEEEAELIPSPFYLWDL